MTTAAAATGPARQAHPLMTRTEVARALRVHPSTVDNWRKHGTLGCVPLPGGQFRYHRSEVATIAAGQPWDQDDQGLPS